MDCKIYVGDLPRDASEKEIERAFCYYGLLRGVWVARNPASFAFVEYEDPRDAEDLDGTNVCGSRVRVDHSTGKIRPKPWMRGSRGPGDLSTLKTDVLNVVTGAIMPTIVLVLSVEGGQGLQGIEPADPDPILDPEGAFLEAGAEVEAVVGLPEELAEAAAETKIPVPFNEATRKDEDLPRRINVLRVYQI